MGIPEVRADIVEYLWALSKSWFEAALDDIADVTIIENNNTIDTETRTTIDVEAIFK